ncbi:unnamed protein product, partial [Discosporangium mesarthrocarpum]
RQWDHLVGRVLNVEEFALSMERTCALLQSGRNTLPPALLEGAFSLFARDPPQVNIWSSTHGIPPGPLVDVLELLAGLSLACRGSLDEKLSFLFSLFDVDSTGTLSEDDVGAMISTCASALTRVGLLNRTSEDEVDFIAAMAFVDEKGRTADTLDLYDFKRWAKSAEHTTRVMEILSLVHRLSRTI